MPFIPLTKGYQVEVDEEDYEYLNQHKWYASCKNRSETEQPIARRSGRDANRKTIAIYIHREVAKRIGLDLTRKIRHIDGNTLNCKRSNLAYVPEGVSTGAQNRLFKENAEISLTPKIDTPVVQEGITIHPVTSKFVASIKLPEERKTIKVGAFDTIEEAVSAREMHLRIREFYL